MPTTIPALRGRIGTTDYWVVTMKCKELTERLVIPKKMKGWDDLSIEEKYQREIKLGRVKKDIAPYFAQDKDRFTGSLIVAVMNYEQMTFERVTDIAKGLPALYQKAAHGIGLLTLNGDEILVPLDGQHRVKAIEYAITGRDDANRDIPYLEPDPSLAQEDIVVLLVRFDPAKSRKIFNKVNRYARKTSKGENLITDDDDHVAVLTRSISGKLIAGRLVRISAATLPKGATEFTTLATLYSCNQAILRHGGHDVGTINNLTTAQRKLMQKEINDTWTLLLKHISAFHTATLDASENGDSDRVALRTENILGKPIGQLSLVRAYLKLRDKLRGCSVTAAPSSEDICRRLDSLDWSVGCDAWQGVLMQGTKVLSGPSVVNLATDFIAWWAGCPFSDEEQKGLMEKIKENLSDADALGFRLPRQVTQRASGGGAL